ncbi:MAG TPA: bacterioferritin [Terriglobales bacterium]|nr:bacterioferritin [Terriglobales bacterium]
MRGNQEVVQQLNTALRSELTAIAQYMVQAETCENWGYSRLAGLMKRRAIEEMHHAEHLIERIVYLDSVPKIDVALTPRLGANVPEQLQSDFADEKEAIATYNAAAKICFEAGDNGSRLLFMSLLHDEEAHADFLEAQLTAIEQMGLPAYLAQQLHAEA